MYSYNLRLQRYEFAFLNQVIKDFVKGGVDTKTFKSWVTKTDYEKLTQLGFVSWQHKLNPTVVKYVVENILRQKPPTENANIA